MVDEVVVGEGVVEVEEEEEEVGIEVVEAVAVVNGMTGTILIR